MKSSFSKEEGSCLAWRENLLNSIEKLKLFWMKQLDKDAIFPLSLISIAIERRAKRCLLKRDRQSFSFSKLSYDRVKQQEGRKEERKEGNVNHPVFRWKTPHLFFLPRVFYEPSRGNFPDISESDSRERERESPSNNHRALRNGRTVENPRDKDAGLGEPG